MSYYVKVLSGVVVQGIVAEPEFFNTFVDSSPGTWINLGSENTAGLGYLYFEDINTFIPPQPYNGWVIKADRTGWEAPMPKPNDGQIWDWDNDRVCWKVSDFQP